MLTRSYPRTSTRRGLQLEVGSRLAEVLTRSGWVGSVRGGVYVITLVRVRAWCYSGGAPAPILLEHTWTRPTRPILTERLFDSDTVQRGPTSNITVTLERLFDHPVHTRTSIRRGVFHCMSASDILLVCGIVMYRCTRG